MSQWSDPQDGLRQGRSYVPPHLRTNPNGPPAPPPSSAAFNGAAFRPPQANGGGRPWEDGHAGGYQRQGGGGGGHPAGRPQGGFGRSQGGYGGNSWGGDYESDPFAQDESRKKEVDALFTAENTGINFDAYDDIPVEATGENVPDPISSFEDIELGPELAANVRRCKYTKPTPVQRYSIPIGLAGRDLMACAQTGSGKTAAFCFPVIAQILKSGEQPTGRSRKAYPLALVLSPTRELSSQIHEESRKFAYQTGLCSVVVYGGAPVVNQASLTKFQAILAAFYNRSLPEKPECSFC